MDFNTIKARSENIKNEMVKRAETLMKEAGEAKDKAEEKLKAITEQGRQVLLNLAEDKPMPLIDLAAQQKLIEKDIKKSFERIMEHGKYIMGPEVAELEKQLSGYVGVKHTISCSSGTDALTLALLALGVGEGDAVFVPAFTFFATAEPIALLGATPVFVDVDPVSFNMDLGKLEDAIKKTKKERKLNLKAIITVSLFGLVMDYSAVRAIADTYDMKVIEDAAQSFGASHNGIKSGTFGDIGCTSFFPAKPLGCYGDGGAVFTDNDELADIMRSLRVHGKGTDKYDNIRIGLNARIDTVQAGILLAKLSIFDDEMEKRQQVAAIYAEHLSEYVDVPQIPEGYVSAYAQYTVNLRNGERERLTGFLRASGIPTAVYYRAPLPLLGAFKDLDLKPEDFPVSVALSQSVVSLPMHPYLDDRDFARIFKAFEAFYKG